MQVRVSFPEVSSSGRSSPEAERSVCVPAGTVLLDAVQRAGLPIARGCGGDGLCARCGVRILASAGPVADETPAEAAVKQRNRIDPRLRLACRVRVEADLRVSAPYW